MTTTDVAERGLSIRDVRVAYGSTLAVAGVSLDAAPGEIVALLGPSGSGKSSLLRAIAGLEPVAGGTIAFDGTVVNQVPVHRRGFGLMFQDGQLFSHRDVAGNIAYGLTDLPRGERARRVEAMTELVGLSDLAHRSVSSLSGGQAQRVALARALAPRPRLMLLDEPLSSLDRAMRERLSSEIRRILKAAGSPSVYVTHDQDEAFTVADRLAILIDGTLVRDASPAEVWADPQTVAVAEFLGYGPMIEVDGALHAVAPGALTIVASDGERGGGLGVDDDGGIHDGGRYDADERVPRPVDVSVLDVRSRRGYCEVIVDLAGQRARARTDWTSARRIRIGERITARLDVSVCPIVNA